MGEVDLDFEPTVPVFDANVALGRRHDKPVPVDTAGGVLQVMDDSGVDRALVYAPHAATYDPRDGNAMLIEQIGGEPRLVPQFVCSPIFDRLNDFADEVETAGVRSVRMLPGLHSYPFRDWVIGPWLDWMADTRTPVWLHTQWQTWLSGGDSLDPRDVYETLKARPEVTGVLSEVKYDDISWALSLLRSLPNPVHRDLALRGRRRDRVPAGGRGRGPGAVRLAVPRFGDAASPVQPPPQRAERRDVEGGLRR